MLRPVAVDPGLVTGVDSGTARVDRCCRGRRQNGSTPGQQDRATRSDLSGTRFRLTMPACELLREHANRAASTFNPKVAGSRPARPIRNSLHTGNFRAPDGVGSANAGQQHGAQGGRERGGNEPGGGERQSDRRESGFPAHALRLLCYVRHLIGELRACLS